MGLNILLPLDGSSLSEEAVAVASKLAATTPSSSIEVLQVVDPSSLGDLTYPRYLLERADQYVTEQVERLRQLGVQATGSVELGPPSGVILNRLESGHFDTWAFCCRRNPTTSSPTGWPEATTKNAWRQGSG